jgi:sorbitol/mannitol transport system substrate-binding protein
MTSSMRRRRLGVAGLGASFALVLSGCAGFGNLGNEPGVTTLTLASVNNPQMQDMNSLLPEFEKLHPDIKVNIIFLEEGDLRNAITKDVATGGGQYDIMTVGAYEVPIWGENGWLVDVTDLAGNDPTYDLNDLFEPVRKGVSFNDRVYALPFYGESSFLMYRKDIFAEAGIQMPERPTWDQVAQYAKQLKTGDRAGICLRGKPGWGDLFASLTTVINTFGGQWYNMNWDAQLTSPEWKEAVNFYLNTLAESGEADPASFSFTECLDLFSTDRAAMWYDATSAAGSVESSPVKGKVGYVRAPVNKTTDSGWLWSWNLGISAESDSKDAAWEFVRWATSKDYLNLVGSQLGWARVPPGTRQSIYEVPQYKEAGGEFAALTKQIMSEVNPEKPGVNPQPWIGIQYVSIPEFQDVGNQVSQEVVDAMAGRRTVDQALKKGQEIAQRAGDLQKEQK